MPDPQTPIDRMREAAKLATIRPRRDGGDVQLRNAAYWALIVQAEAQTRTADALERIVGSVDEDGPTLVVRVSEDSAVTTALARIAAVLEEAHA